MPTEGREREPRTERRERELIDTDIYRKRESIPSQTHITDKSSDNSFPDLLSELHGTFPEGKF